MSVSQNEAISQQISNLIRDVHTRRATDVDAVLGELTESAVEYVAGAQYAGITIAGRDGKVRTAAATGEYPEILDEIQQRVETGHASPRRGNSTSSGSTTWSPSSVGPRTAARRC